MSLLARWPVYFECAWVCACAISSTWSSGVNPSWKKKLWNQEVKFPICIYIDRLRKNSASGGQSSVSYTFSLRRRTKIKSMGWNILSQASKSLQLKEHGIPQKYWSVLASSLLYQESCLILFEQMPSRINPHLISYVVKNLLFSLDTLQKQTYV